MWSAVIFSVESSFEGSIEEVIGVIHGLSEKDLTTSVDVFINSVIRQYPCADIRVEKFPANVLVNEHCL